MNARIKNEKYKLARIFFETLVGYQEASKVKTLDKYW
jgi:hypothetical protein